MIPGNTIPKSLAEYQERMYAEATRLRERTPESTAAMILEAFGDFAYIVAQELDRRDQREDWQKG